MKRIKLLCVLISAFYLSGCGCVAFQKINFDYSPSIYSSTVESANLINIKVEDERPFILSGDKRPSYIGHFRGGYGNTWDVLTDGKVALAEQFLNDIKQELKTIGFDIGLSNEDRILHLSIIDYNFDAMINGRFWYELEVVVFDKENKVLAKDTIKGTHEIKGSLMFGPVGAFKKELPGIYHGIIEKIVRNNDAILEALK